MRIVHKYKKIKKGEMVNLVLSELLSKRNAITTWTLTYQLGCSEEAVLGAIRTLQDAGFPIVKQPQINEYNTYRLLPCDFSITDIVAL